MLFSSFFLFWLLWASFWLQRNAHVKVLHKARKRSYVPRIDRATPCVSGQCCNAQKQSGGGAGRARMFITQFYTSILHLSTRTANATTLIPHDSPERARKRTRVSSLMTSQHRKDVARWPPKIGTFAKSDAFLCSALQQPQIEIDINSTFANNGSLGP